MTPPTAAAGVEPVLRHAARGRHELLLERLGNPEAMLLRTDLRDLGYERRAVDAIFGALPVVELPGYSRPMIRVRDYLELVELNTFDGTRVRKPVLPPVSPGSAEGAGRGHR